MWDPKRLSEDRTPPPRKEAPKKRNGLTVHGTAIGDAVCPGCPKAITHGDRITKFHSLEGSPNEIWHSDCWQHAHFELFLPRDPVGGVQHFIDSYFSEMTNTPKEGDVKDCRKCGEPKAVYKRVTSNATFSGENSPFNEILPDAHAWVCSECGDEQRV